jgi:xanthine dehydrogenase YagS FAD-binding subunit
MITLPTTAAQARAADGTFRAGGTDLTDLRARGIATGPLVDLRDLVGANSIVPTAEGGLRIGALVTLDQLATDPVVLAGWRGVALAAGALATPQIRARATVGGSLLQQVRCWYYRSPEFPCLKKGGATCFARGGDAVFHSLVDLGPCIAPHPSTMAVALLAYDARAEIEGADLRDIPTLLGDGTDPRSTHALRPGQLLTSVVLPPPLAGEQAGYFRAISRARAEWPLVECVVRVRLGADGAIDFATLALGGIANRPIGYPDAGRALVGLKPDDPKVDDLLLGLAPKRAPIAQTAYKALLIPTTVRDTLDQALAGPRGSTTPTKEVP